MRRDGSAAPQWTIETADVPPTRYARSGDYHIAYQTLGEGPPDLLFVHGWISHIEHLWEEPRIARFLHGLASFSRLILLDKRGTGLSDPVPVGALPTLEERMDDVDAVLDAVGSERAALLGTSEAGALDLLYAATHPERVDALVLLNAYARLAWAPDYPFGIRAEVAEELLRTIEARWGEGVAFEALVASQANNASMRQWWARYQRLAASPGAAVTLLRSAYETDARAVLPAISAPVLVLHRAGDPFTGPEHGRYLAERIRGARYVELSGTDHLFFAEDLEQVLAEIREFLTGVREAREPERVLATVMFVDVVGSTAHATRLGDRGWRDLLHRYYAVARRQLARFRGREVSTSGDGIFASFDGPARAIRCARAIVEEVRPLGIRVRAGVHSGECEVIGGKIGGIAVHTGARIAAQAEPDEVLVSSTVRDLVAGSGMAFEDRGGHALRGVPGTWQLFSVGVKGRRR